ncbi:hypothetical protein ACVIRO_002350 [Rhizobium ruizarguesonis]
MGGTVIDPRVSTLCTEYGITVVDGRAYPGIRETRAVTTMERILNSKGEDHFRMVLITLAETENNAAYLDKYLWWAVSDLVEAYSHLVEAQPTEWLKAFDAAPVGELQYIARPLKHQRYALVGMLAERIAIAFGPRATQPDLFSDRRAA